MSRFSGRKYEGQRPHSRIKIIKREIARGRMPRKSPQEQSIKDQKRRLSDLELRLRQEPDRRKKEPLFKQYANLAANCPSEVFTSDELIPIEKYSALKDNCFLSGLKVNPYSGSRPDFLPLHYLLKLLSKGVPLATSDMYVYLLGSTSRNIIDEASARNLRGLEYFLLDFAYRLPRGQFLDVEINGRRIQVENNYEYFSQDNNKPVIELRRRLSAAGIDPSEHYTLRRIKEGHTKVQATLHIVAEQCAYNDQGAHGIVVVSYLTTTAPIKQHGR